MNAHVDFIGTARPVCRAGRVYATVARPSVRLSDYPLSHSHAAAAGLLSLAGWPGDIDRLLHSRRSAARRAAANADSTALSAKGRG